jgi:phosphoribosylformylglycinamidine cyclo-ligase
MAHITGGGLAGNLVRVLPKGISAVIDRSTLPTLPILELIAHQGNVSQAEMDKTFNNGVGFALVVRSRDAADVCAFFRRRKVPAHIIGKTVSGRRGVRFEAKK